MSRFNQLVAGGILLFCPDSYIRSNASHSTYVGTPKSQPGAGWKNRRLSIHFSKTGSLPCFSLPLSPSSWQL